MSISNKDIANPEPYHEVLIELYNKNESAIINVISKGFNENKEINLFVWINLITTLISSVEKYKKLTGSTKQRIVLEICLMIVDKVGDSLSEQNKFTIKIIIQKTFPQIIDELVALSKKINTKKRIGRCFSKVFSCLLLTIIPEPEAPIVIEQPPVQNEPIVVEEQPIVQEQPN